MHWSAAGDYRPSVSRAGVCLWAAYRDGVTAQRSELRRITRSFWIGRVSNRAELHGTSTRGNKWAVDCAPLLLSRGKEAGKATIGVGTVPGAIVRYHYVQMVRADLHLLAR